MEYHMAYAQSLFLIFLLILCLCNDFL